MSEKSREELLLEYEKDYLQRLVNEGKLKPDDVRISEEVRNEMSVAEAEKVQADAAAEVQAASAEQQKQKEISELQAELQLLKEMAELESELQSLKRQLKRPSKKKVSAKRKTTKKKASPKRKTTKSRKTRRM